jgi:hypothetical protein
MPAYMSGAVDSHLHIEKVVKIHKCHRNILDQEGAYLDNQLKVIEGHVEEVKAERASLLVEKVEGKKEAEVEKEPKQRQPEAEIMSDFFKIT